MEPDNRSTDQNPVGRFMVAVGSVVEYKNTGRVLLIKRSDNLDWHAGEWEIGYGRMAQFESIEQGLRREIGEELGIRKLEVVQLLTAWHIFRGSEKAENELIGMTFHCRTDQEKIIISDEHQAYKWVTVPQALEMVRLPGVKRDLRAFYSRTVTLGQARRESRP